MDLVLVNSPSWLCRRESVILSEFPRYDARGFGLGWLSYRQQSYTLARRGGTTRRSSDAFIRCSCSYSLSESNASDMAIGTALTTIYLHAISSPSLLATIPPGDPK